MSLPMNANMCKQAAIAKFVITVNVFRLVNLHCCQYHFFIMSRVYISFYENILCRMLSKSMLPILSLSRRSLALQERHDNHESS